MSNIQYKIELRPGVLRKIRYNASFDSQNGISDILI